MSTTTKIILAVTLGIVIFGGLIYLMNRNNSNNPSGNSASATGIPHAV